VRDGRAENENRQRQYAGGDDACVAMAPKSEIECRGADRDYHEQQLRMQVIVPELAQEGQGQHHEWQQQAMGKAQPGQRDRYLVQDFRLSGTVIHHHLPLCSIPVCEALPVVSGSTVCPVAR